ncbi:MAG TPA: hypothetical protein DEO32_00825 [Ruminococcaceae bacterium]|nr:hypothetical protein [Oscillospiraceae bacterium]
MKKILVFLVVLIAILLFAELRVSADSYDMSEIYNSVSDEVKSSMKRIGADSADASALDDISFESVMSELAKTAENQSSAPLKSLIRITAVLLICSMLSAYQSGLSNTARETVGTVAALCVSCAVTAPAVTLISNTQEIIITASNLMLAYVPIMAVILTAGGSPASAGAYYASVLLAGEGVSSLCSRVIIPFLNMFLGLGIVSGVAPNVNINGFISLISRVFKWLLGFSMAVFTSILGVKQLISGSLDTVSARAVKFAVSSFVPVVGGALADAYKTVQGSIGLLKSGAGVFVIIAVAFTFLPVVIEGMLWQLSMSVGKGLSETLGLNRAAALLEALASVFSAVLSVTLCVAAVYIISTAVILLSGGAS